MTESEWWAATYGRQIAHWVLSQHHPTARKRRLLATAWCWQLLPFVTDVPVLIEFVASMESAADGRTTWESVDQLYRRCDVDQRNRLPDQVLFAWEAILLAYAPDPFGDDPRTWPFGVCSVALRGFYDGAVLAADPPNLVRPLHDIFGPLPFRDVAVQPSWLTSDVLALARGIYDEKAFDRMPILADALQDAGCDNDDILSHCREQGREHVRGCWVIDLLLGRPWRESS